MSENLHKLEMRLRDDENDRKLREDKWKSRRTRGDDLLRHRQIFMEIVLVRHVENYLSFLARLLYEIFTERPETLKSSDKIEVASVLSHDSIEGLVRSIAERKVESLSYQSFQDLYMFFDERFSIKLFEPKEFETMIEMIEIRNISVHNRCVINERFLARTNSSKDSLGNQKVVTYDHLEILVPLLAHSVLRADKRARSHLRIRGKKMNLA